MDLIPRDEWFHFAAVSGPGGMKLYFNGSLVASNAYTGSIASLGNNARNTLGLGIPQNGSPVYFDGQLDEMRVWKVMRTEQQIRDSMSRRLTGKEDGLAGLWGFDDGTANDSSTNAYHGKLMGHAKVIEATLPKPVELTRPTLLSGTVTDVDGTLVPNARVELERSGSVIMNTTNAADGRFMLVLHPNAEPYELWVTAGESAARFTGLKIQPGEQKQIDIKLKPAASISGSVLALDSTPLRSVVVQLVKPVLAEQDSSPSRSSGSKTSSVKLADDLPIVDTVQTDAEGKFKFTNLKPGSYRVRCHVLGGFKYYEEGVVIEENTPLQIPNPKSIDFRLAPFKKGTWKTYTVRDGLPNRMVMSFLQQPDAAGQMWLGTAGGASRFDGKTFVNFTPQNGWHLISVYSICSEPDGVLWFGTGEDGVTRFDPRTGEKRQFSAEDAMFRAPIGPDVTSSARDAQGGLWFGGWGGFCRYDGKEFKKFKPNGGVWTVYATPDDIVWVAVEGEGVRRYMGDEYTTLSTKDGLVGNSVHSILRDEDGSMWFGAFKGVSHYDGQHFYNLTKTDGLIGPEVRVIRRDAEGALWFGLSNQAGNDGGAYRYDGKSLVRFTAADGLPAGGDGVWDIRCDPDGVVWFACTGGLARYDPNRVTNFGRADGLANYDVGKLHVASDRTLWMGSLNGGLTHLDGNHFVKITSADGLPSGRRLSMASSVTVKAISGSARSGAAVCSVMTASVSIGWQPGLVLFGP